MTYEEIKNRLDDIKKKRRKLAEKDRQIAQVRAEISLPAIDYSITKVTNKGGISQQERYLALIERLEEEKYNLMENLFTAEDSVTELLYILPSIEQDILTERYMHHMSWKRIYQKFGYTEDGVMKLHRRALKKLANK